jgi:hypothetical protein
MKIEASTRRRAVYFLRIFDHLGWPSPVGAFGGVHDLWTHLLFIIHKGVLLTMITKVQYAT